MPWSLTVLEPVAAAGEDPQVAGAHNFPQPFLPSLFATFGVLDRLTDSEPPGAMSFRSSSGPSNRKAQPTHRRRSR